MVFAGFRRDAQFSAQEGGPQLGNQFFFGVTFITPLFAAKITVEAGRVPRGVGDLMGKGRINLEKSDEPKVIIWSL